MTLLHEVHSCTATVTAGMPMFAELMSWGWVIVCVYFAFCPQNLYYSFWQFNKKKFDKQKLRALLKGTATSSRLEEQQKKPGANVPTCAAAPFECPYPHHDSPFHLSIGLSPSSLHRDRPFKWRRRSIPTAGDWWCWSQSCRSEWCTCHWCTCCWCCCQRWRWQRQGLCFVFTRRTRTGEYHRYSWCARGILSWCCASFRVWGRGHKTREGGQFKWRGRSTSKQDGQGQWQETGR